MVESIAARMKRVVSGSFSASDPAEGAHALLDELREIDAVIDEARRAAEAAACRRLQALRQAQTNRQKIAALTAHAKAALQEGREKVAQAAISEQIDLESQLIMLADAERDAANIENNVERDIAALFARRKELKAQYDAVAARRHTHQDHAPTSRDETGIFNVAMKAANDAIGELALVGAQMDLALREKQVADRLAAMKAAM